jgi:hypothetical protein
MSNERKEIIRKMKKYTKRNTGGEKRKGRGRENQDKGGGGWKQCKERERKNKMEPLLV